jgi:hypothetical protein
MLMLRSVQSCRKVMIISDDLETMKQEEIVAYFKTLSRLSSGRFEKTMRRVLPSSSTQIAFFLMGWDWVHSVRRPLIGLLYQPRIINDKCGAIGGMRIGRGNRSTRRKPAQCHFVHHKSHMTWPGLQLQPPQYSNSIPASQTQSVRHYRTYNSPARFTGHARLSDRTLVFSLRYSERIHFSYLSEENEYFIWVFFSYFSLSFQAIPGVIHKEIIPTLYSISLYSKRYSSLSLITL